ncbi:MAG: hypothetical protein J6J17_05060 [Bacilli bacterium]|nr:hypothetical protein [Bacilli bacterium]
MRIGIDIDGVLTNVEEFEIDYGSKYFYETGIYNTIKDVDFTKENYNIDEDTSNRFWSKAIYDYIKVKPRNFACEVIKKLKEEGNTICIVTNRISDLSYCDITKEEMKDVVIKWLKRNSIYYDELIFSNDNKVQFIIDNKIDIMIEDNSKNIKAISEIIPVICFNAGYNKSCSGKNIIRCFSWYDIYAKISKLKNN